MENKVGTMVGHLSHHPQVEGSSPASATGAMRGKMKKKGSMVLEYQLDHPKVEASTAASTGRGEMEKHMAQW